MTRVENILRPYGVYNIPINNPVPDRMASSVNADDTGRTVTYCDYSSAYAGERFESPWIVNDPTADEKYNSFEIAASRRLVNRWQVLASFSATHLDVPYAVQVGSAIAFQAALKDPNSEIFSADNDWEWVGQTADAVYFPVPASP